MAEELEAGVLGRVAGGLTAWSTRWVPDAFVIAALLTALAAGLALAFGDARAVLVAINTTTVEVPSRQITSRGVVTGTTDGQPWAVVLDASGAPRAFSRKHDGGVLELAPVREGAACVALAAGDRRFDLDGRAAAGGALAPLPVSTRGAVPVLVQAWGVGFFEAKTLAFAVKMALIMLGGWILARSGPIARLIDVLARVPRTPRQAVLVMALASMGLGLFNWGLSIVASAVLVRAIARRVPRVDYPLLCCAAYLGLGCVWHAGLSGSAPLLVVAKNHDLWRWVPHDIPLTETIFSRFNLGLTATCIAVLAVVTPLLHPSPTRTRAVDPALLAEEEAVAPALAPATTPAHRIERSPVVSVALAALLGGVFAQTVLARGLAGLDLNAVILFFFALGLLFHGNPASFLRAAESGGPQVWAIVLQFPFYAAIAHVVDASGLGERIAHAFTAAATKGTYPLFLCWYSGILNYVVPSGGAKVFIEAPYIFAAGRSLGVEDSRTLLAYAWGDMLTDVIQPFWAIPLLAVAKLEFRDIMGYALILFVVYATIVSAFFAAFG